MNIKLISKIKIDVFPKDHKLFHHLFSITRLIIKQ